MEIAFYRCVGTVANIFPVFFSAQFTLVHGSIKGNCKMKRLRPHQLVTILVTKNFEEVTWMRCYGTSAIICQSAHIKNALISFAIDLKKNIHLVT
jgi:hypothetical protein